MATPRTSVEGTLGFWYKPYNGPKGRLQFGMQYSYLTKTAWAGIGTKLPVPRGSQPVRDRQHVLHVLPLLPAVRLKGGWCSPATLISSRAKLCGLNLDAPL